MKFVFADSLDYVDPKYDFLGDRTHPQREAYWSDQFPHEILGYAPYDGILVSRGIVGGAKVKGKYSESQAMRFRIVGARKFLRLGTPEFAHVDVFGDCGAFTYVNDEVPPYDPEDMIEYYEDGGFTHGCSVDHIIFDFEPNAVGCNGGSEEARRRFDITLENASNFLAGSRRLGVQFTPLGVVQGWSPASMAEAARRLCAMGYTYLAVGGMVPLKSNQIKQCLRTIREAIPVSTRLHILGFAKANDIATFSPFGITSFDTTSPLIRAFKDGKQNYYSLNAEGELEYFTAIRVPQAIENNQLMRLVREGRFKPEDLSRLEKSALGFLRRFDAEEADMDETLDAVTTYSAPLMFGRSREEIDDKEAVKLDELTSRYRQTLEAKAWKKCACAICQQAGIEVMIFRASNRNKRRGIHNLSVFKTVVDRLEGKNAHA